MRIMKIMKKKLLKKRKLLLKHWRKILEDGDYNTFEVLPNGNGKDKNRSYEYLTKDEEEWF